MAKTISRNRKSLIEQILDTAHECRAYSLENGFSGADVPLQVVRDALERGAKLQACEKEVGSNHEVVIQFFRVTVHSNRWYEFFSDTEA